MSGLAAADATIARHHHAAAPLIERLHCPYCGSRLDLSAQLPSRPDYGVLRCACARFPVVEGIPILQHLEGVAGVVRLIEKGDSVAALLHAMNVFRIRWARRSRWHQLRYRLDCRRLITGRDLSFEDAVGLVRKPQGFADYLFHRFANPSFMSDTVLLPLLAAFVRERNEAGGDGSPVRILDVACGAGHSSFLVAHCVRGAEVIAADHDFVSLYLAKRFVAPAARFVCADTEVPSPFPDGFFDAVHCLDAFHYFKSKRAIVAELRRVARRDALWLFPHLHNALAENVTAGIPLAPDEYARCFDGLRPHLFDEARLLRGDLCEGPPVPEAAQPPGELTGAQSLAMVAGPVAAGLETLPALLARTRSSLAVNPVYRAGWQRGSLALERRWPNDVLRRECLDAERILPAALKVSRDQIAALLNADGGGFDGGTGRALADLVCRFVFVPLPARYRRDDPLRSLRPAPPRDAGEPSPGVVDRT